MQSEYRDTCSWSDIMWTYDTDFCVTKWRPPLSIFHCLVILKTIWAPSSEFVSSSIPSWQILTAHAQPFRGARDLAFCLKVPLDSLLVWASSGGSGETAQMRRLAWTFAARIGDNYQIRLTQPIWCMNIFWDELVRPNFWPKINVGQHGLCFMVQWFCPIWRLFDGWTSSFCPSPLFEEKRGDIVFGFPWFRPPF